MNSCCDLYGSFPDARRRLPGEDHLRGDRLPPVQELQELRADARLRRRLAVERARALDGGRSRRGINLGTFQTYSTTILMIFRRAFGNTNRFNEHVRNDKNTLHLFYLEEGQARVHLGDLENAA